MRIRRIVLFYMMIPMLLLPLIVLVLHSDVGAVASTDNTAAVRDLLQRLLPNHQQLFLLQISPLNNINNINNNNNNNNVDNSNDGAHAKQKGFTVNNVDPFPSRSSDSVGFFQIESLSNGSVLVTGNDGISLASGVHYYLKYFGNWSVSWWGDNLPAPGDKVGGVLLRAP